MIRDQLRWMFIWAIIFWAVIAAIAGLFDMVVAIVELIP